MARLSRVLSVGTLLAAAGCASAPLSVPAPAPSIGSSARPETASIGRNRPAIVDSVRIPAVPAFRPMPLVTWGPLPGGIAHAERERTYDLQHQIVHVRFDWARRAVVGSTTLRVAALPGAAPLREVRLDAGEMTIGAVRDASGRALRFTHAGEALTVQLGSPAQRATFTVDYEAVRPRHGVYFVERRHIVWTQSESEDARYWVPTYDYPNDKTTWEFFIRTDAREKALSNGRLVGTRRIGRETEWHWSLDKPASTYLMSVVTGDYTVLQDTWRRVPVGYWTYPDSVEAGWRGFGHTPRALEMFSAKTGVDYPWAKYDQSVTPDYIFGGMENVTATTQADDGILHPAWAEPQANADALMAHELGHQWYGDLVTARSWPHAWLNEGFATFMEQVFREEDKGRDEGAFGRLTAQEAVLAADVQARRPIVYDRWVTNPFETFGPHIYQKGSVVLQSLRHQLGDSLFWRAMNHFTVKHSYGSAVTDDLRLALEESTGRSLSPFFAQWVYGAGSPAFRVSYAVDSAAGTVTVSAQEVQPRDSLTGWFDVDVDVEVRLETGSGELRDAVRGVARVRDGEARLTLDLPRDAAGRVRLPMSIRWDKGGWLLDVSDFPRSTAMLAWQLAHDDDIIGRIEAADLLALRAGEPNAVRALAAAVRADSFWAVRARALPALAAAAIHADSAATTVARDAVLAALGDRDPRVREAAPTALASLSPQLLASRMERLLADSSRYVGGAALLALARTDSAAAIPLIDRILARDSWIDLERTQAVYALGALTTNGSWDTIARYLADGTSRRTRVAAVEALTRRSAAREPELTTRLVPLLDASDHYVRVAAATALGTLGQASAIAALEKRKSAEPESRVVNAIDAALLALRARRGP